MDRATELTDAFVEGRFADYDLVRTKTCRRTLNPVWNEDFRIEVSNDADLQNEPLEVKVLDYDQITYSDAIGAVFIDLNPLLAWDSNQRDSNSLSGWFPLFDSLRGVCGEIFITVKLNFFGDSNQYADSSTAVQFFTTPSVPPTYIVTSIHGFVNTLERDDDPEFHWADNFRTPRTSNDARMRIMYRLSGQLRRQLGKKVLDLGGNAILGYKQCFDFETEQKTITARAIGTAVTLATPEQVMATLIHSPSLTGDVSSLGLRVGTSHSTGALDQPFGLVNTMSHSVGNLVPEGSGAQRHSLLTSPLGISIPSQQQPLPSGQISSSRLADSPVSSPSDSNLLPPPVLPTPQPKPVDQYPVTLHTFPPGAIQGLGGLVCATSVKIMDNASDNEETREVWWDELRAEIKSHARSLKCALVVGYTEQMTVCDELVVLYCYGTAAVVDFGAFEKGVGALVVAGGGGVEKGGKSRVASSSASLERGVSLGNGVGGSAGYEDVENQVPQTPGAALGRGNSFKDSAAYFEKMAKRGRKKKRTNPGCQACHITYSRADPFQTNTTFTRCGVCKKKFVPEIILSTIEPPTELETIGKSVMIEAHVCRIKKSRVGESHAVIVSESMPFAQYDIHRQLLFKLRIHGLNAIFGLKIQYSIGESLMTAVATGTAVYLKALPPPPPLKLLRTLEVEDAEDRQLVEDQRRIMEQSEWNRKQIEEALAREVEMGVGSLGSISGRKKSGTAAGVGGGGLEEAVGTPPVRRDSAQSNEEVGESESESDESVSSDSDPEYEVSNRQRNVVVQIDDEHDEDLMLLMDATFREGFQLKNIEAPIKSELVDRNALFTVQSVTMIRQGLIPLSSHHPNRQLARLFQDLYQELQFQFACVSPCMIVGVDYDIQVLKMNEIQIRWTGVALGVVTEESESATESEVEDIAGSGSFSEKVGTPSRKSGSKPVLNVLGPRQLTDTSLVTTTEDGGDAGAKSDNDSDGADDDLMYSDDDIDEAKMSTPGVPGADAGGPSGTTPPISAVPYAVEALMNQTSNPPSPPPPVRPSIGFGLVSSHPKASISPTPRAVEITPLSYVPQARIEKFLGRVSLHFVKEAEFYAIARAYTVALGGNAMISFTVEQSMFYESIKNQGYSLISVSGDVVEVAYSAKRKMIYERQKLHHHSVLLKEA
ncbi:hypothetical protein HDU98_007238 [Podochytrium sp. JEL0797]|nr:hypothetical protein HDU98_007238 [Podochytrium sp. JEL0797]